jgi:hypothetical protein
VTILIPVGLIFLFCCCLGCFYECFFLKRAELARSRLRISPGVVEENNPEYYLHPDELNNRFYVRQQDADILNYYEIITEGKNSNAFKNPIKDDLPSYDDAMKKF